MYRLDYLSSIIKENDDWGGTIHKGYYGLRYSRYTVYSDLQIVLSYSYNLYFGMNEIIAV
jgi:hypothetical protein